MSKMPLHEKKSSKGKGIRIRSGNVRIPISKYETIHKKNVTELKKELGNVPLTDRKINTICRKMFNSKYLGCFMQDSKIPSKDGYMIMNNDFEGNNGIHWLSCIKSGKNMYIYDSFGRNSKNILPYLTKSMIGKGYKVHNADLSDQDQYGYKSFDCGHRALSSLMIAKKYGIKAFMSL